MPDLFKETLICLSSTRADDNNLVKAYLLKHEDWMCLMKRVQSTHAEADANPDLLFATFFTCCTLE